MSLRGLILGLSLCLSSTAAWALDVTLQWDANRDIDLWGYHVLYREDMPGPPFDGHEAVQSGSPVIYYVSGLTAIPTAFPVDNSTSTCEVTIQFPNISGHDVDRGYRDVFFVVTAFDTEGMMSGFSNQVRVGSDLPDGTSGPPFPILGLRITGTGTDTTPIFDIASGLPFRLQAPTQDLPESGVVIVNIKEISAGWSAVEIHMSVYDPDYTDEGELYVNGTYVMALWPAGSPVKDGMWMPEFLSLDSSLFRPGPNVLEFRHTSTGGFDVSSVVFEVK